jgi:hypothetical protein
VAPRILNLALDEGELLLPSNRKNVNWMDPSLDKARFRISMTGYSDWFLSFPPGKLYLKVGVYRCGLRAG